MNYRHAYHAGNICDVVKHGLLTLILEKLKTKEKPFAVLDTHAGSGSYDLLGEQAQKTQEAEQGIFRLKRHGFPDALKVYEEGVRKANATDSLEVYPGSPALISDLLRDQDRLMACELHPEEAKKLQRRFYDTPNVQIHARDGYEALTALLPPREKRGLVLIDPPYESKEEYARLVESLKKLYARWPQASVLVWYPVKDRPELWKFHESLIAAGIPKILVAEFVYAPEVQSDRLVGSGQILINPPWGLEEEIQTLFPALHRALGACYTGDTIKWLVPEIKPPALPSA